MRSLLFIIIFYASVAQATELVPVSIWATQRAWDVQAESEYVSWLRENMEGQFFARHQFEVTSESLPALLRWIFARENGLPAANSIGHDRDVLLTNQSGLAEWRELPTGGRWFEDARFLAALKMLAANVTAQSLWRDSYPISLNSEALRPGAFGVSRLQTDSPAVFIVVGLVNRGGVLLTLRAQASQKLEFDFFNDRLYPRVASRGFYRLRWAVDVGGPIQLHQPELMPFFSQEQFDESWQTVGRSFALVLEERLAVGRGLATDRYQWMVEGLLAQLAERRKRVDQGARFCAPGVERDCADENSVLYQKWNTAAQDAQLTTWINWVDYRAMEVPEYSAYWHRFAGEAKVEVGHGLGAQSLFQICENFLLGRVSSNPSVSIENRWGIQGL